MPREHAENTPASVDAAYQILHEIYKKHRRKYRANPDSKQMCCLWSMSRLPDILAGTQPLCDIEDAFGVSINEDDAVKIHDMDLDEATREIMKMVKKQRS